MTLGLLISIVLLILTASNHLDLSVFQILLPFLIEVGIEIVVFLFLLLATGLAIRPSKRTRR